LRAHRVRQRTERLLAGSRWHDDPRDLVFRTSIGTPMDGIAVTRRFSRRSFGIPVSLASGSLMALGQPAREVGRESEREDPFEAVQQKLPI
jgi:hypothetical protein